MVLWEDKMVTVHNLVTGETAIYSCSPEEAVIAAHAQEHGDWNGKRYGGMVVRGEWSVGVGNWAARVD